MHRDQLLIFAAILTAVVSGGSVCAQDVSLPPQPAPGRLVDVGGWRRHLHCTGEARENKPTVIMVGHSYGGWLVQLYVSTYPADVAGIALIEPGESDPLRLTADGSAKRSSQLPARRPIPPITPSSPLRESDVPPVAITQMKAAAQRARPDPNPAEREKLPADAQRMRAWALGRWQHIAATFNPFELEELAALRADHA